MHKGGQRPCKPEMLFCLEEHWSWALQTSQRRGGERWALRQLWGLPRLFTSPRLTGNYKHAQQRPERGLAAHTHLHTEERKEARGGEESLRSDCPSTHTHHQQGRELTAPSA